jgi:hypothetical protein
MLEEKYEWTIRISDGDGFWEYVFPDGCGDISMNEVAKIVGRILKSDTEVDGRWIGND